MQAFPRGPSGETWGQQRAIRKFQEEFGQEDLGGWMRGQARKHLFSTRHNAKHTGGSKKGLRCCLFSRCARPGGRGWKDGTRTTDKGVGAGHAHSVHTCKRQRTCPELGTRREGWGHTNGLCVANLASKDHKEARALQFLNIPSAKPP